jgi:hypothetical protein
MKPDEFTRRFDRLLLDLSLVHVNRYTVAELRFVNQVIDGANRLRVGSWDTPDGEGKYRHEEDENLLAQMEKLAGKA